MMVVLNLSGCFHVTSAAFTYSAWSKHTRTSKDLIVFSDLLSTSLTIAICVAGALMVGKYPTLSETTVTSSHH